MYGLRYFRMTPAVCNRSLYLVRLLTYPTVSEITIEPCMMGAYMAYLCSPHTTVEEDATKGKWVRVGRNLNFQSGLWGLVRPVLPFIELNH